MTGLAGFAAATAVGLAVLAPVGLVAALAWRAGR